MELWNGWKEMRVIFNRNTQHKINTKQGMNFSDSISIRISFLFFFFGLLPFFSEPLKTFIFFAVHFHLFNFISFLLLIILPLLHLPPLAFFLPLMVKHNSIECQNKKKVRNKVNSQFANNKNIKKVYYQ